MSGLRTALQYDQSNGCTASSIFDGYNSTFSDVLDIGINLCVRYAPRGEISPILSSYSKYADANSVIIRRNVRPQSENIEDASNLSGSESQYGKDVQASPLEDKVTVSSKLSSNINEITILRPTASPMPYPSWSARKTFPINPSTDSEYLSNRINSTSNPSDYISNRTDTHTSQAYIPMTHCPPPLSAEFKSMGGDLEGMERAERHALDVCEETMEKVRNGEGVRKMPVYEGCDRPVIADGGVGTVGYKIEIFRTGDVGGGNGEMKSGGKDRNGMGLVMVLLMLI